MADQVGVQDAGLHARRVAIHALVFIETVHHLKCFDCTSSEHMNPQREQMGRGGILTVFEGGNCWRAQVEEGKDVDEDAHLSWRDPAAAPLQPMPQRCLGYELARKPRCSKKEMHQAVWWQKTTCPLHGLAKPVTCTHATSNHPRGLQATHADAALVQ